jgi:hypothetical protein
MTCCSQIVREEEGAATKVAAVVLRLHGRWYATSERHFLDADLRQADVVSQAMLLVRPSSL